MKHFMKRVKAKLIYGPGLIILCMAFLITACSGPPGAVYLSYSWVSLPQHIYDENPATPATIYNGEYFPSAPGSYYMEYIAWDGSGWWMEYTLTAVDGGLFGAAGDESYFEITLYSTGPTLWRWNTARSLDAAEADNTADTSAGMPVIIAGDVSGREPLPDIIGRESRRSGSCTLDIRFGALQ